MSSRGKSDGSVMINNTNVFALLGSKKKKPKGKRSSAKSGVEKAVEEKKVFWAPAPLNAKSWADVDDDDDDDYYATTAPPQAVWGSTEQQLKKESPVHIEESESDEDILGEGDIDLDEENYSEPETEKNPEPVVKSFVPAIVVKEPERQLSKKEIRKKELEELDAILADLNITPNENNGHDEHQGTEVEKKELQPTEEAEMNGAGAAESKTSKKKKKTAKSSREVKEIQNHEEDNTETEKAEEDAASVDHVKEKLKKWASMKKKKPSRDTDTDAKAAAAEAAARRQKLEAAKKKEKSHLHYNQQPVR